MANLGPPLDQIGKLIIGQAVEDAQRAKLVDVASDRGQVAVHEIDRHRTFTDRRRDPLHRVEPNVAGREHAGTLVSSAKGARLQRPRGRCRESAVLPVTTNPLSSRTISGPSQSVRGARR